MNDARSPSVAAKKAAERIIARLPNVISELELSVENSIAADEASTDLPVSSIEELIGGYQDLLSSLEQDATAEILGGPTEIVPNAVIADSVESALLAVDSLVQTLEEVEPASAKGGELLLLLGKISGMSSVIYKAVE